MGLGAECERSRTADAGVGARNGILGGIFPGRSTGRAGKSARLANTSLALGYWASSDPKAASVWLTGHSSSPLEADGVEKVSAALMLQSPQSAVDWAANFPAGTNREDVLRIVREQLGEASGLSAEEAAALKARLF